MNDIKQKPVISLITTMYNDGKNVEKNIFDILDAMDKLEIAWEYSVWE